jgi:hypothetical protein
MHTYETASNDTQRNAESGVTVTPLGVATPGVDDRSRPATKLTLRAGAVQVALKTRTRLLSVSAT